MPRYKVLEVSYIHDVLRQPGEEVDWDPKKHGTAGPNLEPLTKRKAATKESDDINPEDADLGTEE